MITTILALMMTAPTASANSLRQAACEKVGGVWREDHCEYSSASTDIKYIQAYGLDELGLIQISIRVDEDEWVMPTPGEVFVPMPSGDFARAPLELAVQMHLDADYAEEYAEAYELERTESPVESALESLDY